MLAKHTAGSLWYFHKFSRQEEGSVPSKTGEITKGLNFFDRFVGFEGKLPRWHNFATDPNFPVYAKAYAWVLHRQSGRIPVENCEFSTFSTDFSTGVVHRHATLWICILVYINQYRNCWLFACFFCGHILHNFAFGGFKNNSWQTRSPMEPDFPPVSTRLKKSQKFLKKVLILLKSGCIMWNRMK